jgi:hypothetical protein
MRRVIRGRLNLNPLKSGCYGEETEYDFSRLLMKKVEKKCGLAALFAENAIIFVKTQEVDAIQLPPFRFDGNDLT